MIKNNSRRSFFQKVGFANWLLVPLSILGLYFFLEGLTYLLICGNVLRPDFNSVFSKNLGTTDMPYTQFDSISGYKYIGHLPHLTNINDGHLVYDHVMAVNNKGYCSVYDYAYKKKPGNFRWMVFGDSYSAGEITDTTWVDLFQNRFDGNGIEFYNFSLEGAGIKGWHNIFFKEVVPEYEFDGVVLAVFGDFRSTSYDLARDFIIKYSFDDYTGLNFFPSLPQNTIHFESEYKQQLFYESSIYKQKQIEKYRAKLISSEKQHFAFGLVKPRLYFINYLKDAFRFILKNRSFQKIYGTKNIDMKIVSGAYKGEVDYHELFGKENMQKTDEILNYCRTHDKKVYLISIPNENIVNEDPSFYHNNLYNRHLKLLSERYGCNFYDGYELYDSVPVSQRDRFKLYGDSHWNRKGIDLFVKLLSHQKENFIK